MFIGPSGGGKSTVVRALHERGAIEVGFRVAEYGTEGLKEVGAFIDEGGNNFWGVEFHEHPDGQYYVLASDRDYGLYVLQYTGETAGSNRGNTAANPRP